MREAAAELDRLMKWDDLVARVYDDSRMPPSTRELALALAWALERGPTARPGAPFWRVVRECLGRDLRGWRLPRLLKEDVPRYVRPDSYSLAAKGRCEGPRMRPYQPRPDASACQFPRHPHLGACRTTQMYGVGAPAADHTRGGTMCGAPGAVPVDEADMTTGWVRTRWFCRRHADRAQEVRQQLAARGEPPEPVPNTGGLLPRYFQADWVAFYRQECGASWQPPSYGVNADDWPHPAAAQPPRRGRLSLVPTEPT